MKIWAVCKYDVWFSGHHMVPGYTTKAEITYSLEANIIAHELTAILCMGQSTLLGVHCYPSPADHLGNLTLSTECSALALHDAITFIS